MNNDNTKADTGMDPSPKMSTSVGSLRTISLTKRINKSNGKFIYEAYNNLVRIYKSAPTHRTYVAMWFSLSSPGDTELNQPIWRFGRVDLIGGSDSKQINPDKGALAILAEYKK